MMSLVWNNTPLYTLHTLCPVGSDKNYQTLPSLFANQVRLLKSSSGDLVGSSHHAGS